jgi:hypothetical protein
MAITLGTTNPQVPQGTLNRLFGTLQVVSYPALNITPSYLGKEGFSLRFETPATDYIDTMTGGVTSPAPYQKIGLTAHLLRTQPLSILYEQQKQILTTIGTIVLYIDSTIFPAYTFLNCSIMNTEGLERIDGTSADYAVPITGYYSVNSQIWT